MEHKIGEVFEDGGVNLRVEKSIKGCHGCAFRIITGKILCAANGNMEKCRPSQRKDHNNVIFVKVNNNKNMETRNIKLDLDTAKEWFKGSDETLKKLALQVYKEEELVDNLPKTWEEYDTLFPSKVPSEKSAKAHSALFKLEQLRDCYRQGWVPDWENDEHKYVIYNFKNKIIFNTDIDGTNHFLSFPTMELCDKFYNNFKYLIEVAKDLI